MVCCVAVHVCVAAGVEVCGGRVDGGSCGNMEPVPGGYAAEQAMQAGRDHQGARQA